MGQIKQRRLYGRIPAKLLYNFIVKRGIVKTDINLNLQHAASRFVVRKENVDSHVIDYFKYRRLLLTSMDLLLKGCRLSIVVEPLNIFAFKEF